MSQCGTLCVTCVVYNEMVISLQYALGGRGCVELLQPSTVVYERLWTSGLKDPLDHIWPYRSPGVYFPLFGPAFK